MKEIKCPNCNKPTKYEGNEFRPFCSERCRMIDFGVWADGGYGIPAESELLTEEDLQTIENVRNSEE